MGAQIEILILSLGMEMPWCFPALCRALERVEKWVLSFPVIMRHTFVVYRDLNEFGYTSRMNFVNFSTFADGLPGKLP